MQTNEYDTNLLIQYNNNTEYRKSLRTLFRMNTSATDLDVDIDEETRDEMLYDELSTSTVLEYVFMQTKHHRLFQHLYDGAASLMFSMNRNIGMTVLFSYDYLVLFHPCICEFLKTENLDENGTNYVSLRKKLFD
jgi:hypothetical protein